MFAVSVICCMLMIKTGFARRYFFDLQLRGGDFVKLVHAAFAVLRQTERREHLNSYVSWAAGN